MSKNQKGNNSYSTDGGQSSQKTIIRYSVDDFFNKTVKSDFETLQSKVSLATTPKVEKLHLMHSVYGHACAGHGEFYEIVGNQKVPVQYKNITIDDVITNIPKQNPAHVKRERQEVIDHISEWLSDRIETLKNPGRAPLQEDIRLIKIYDDKENKNKDDKGNKRRIEPLAGVSMFEHAILKNFESVLIGFYLGSCMDSYEWREKVDKKFGVQMHKGTSVAVDIFAMRRNNLSLEDLQNSEYLNKMPRLSKLDSDGIIKDFIAAGIIPKECSVSNNKKYTSAFLELSKGYGISDDAAFITASLLFGTEAGFGLLLADAIDTLDKYTPTIRFGGQDELAGELLKKQYETRLLKKFPVTEEQILTFIYLSAITKEEHANFPSCSQRRFWQKDGDEMTAVQSHMSFLNFLKNDSKYPPLTRIGFKNVSNNQFYSAYIRRLEDVIAKGIIADKYSLIEKKRTLNSDSDSVLIVN